MKRKAIIFGFVIVFLGISFFSIRGIIERTRVSVEKIEYSGEAEIEKEEFKYLKLRLGADILINYSFRERTGEENILEIKKIKQELEEINSEKLKEKYLEDFKVLERELGELKKVLEEEKSEADKQLSFIKKSTDFSKEGKVSFFTSRAAFSKDKGNLGEDSILLVNGTEILIQETKDKINVLLGGENGIGITFNDLEKNDSLKNEGEVFLVDKKTERKISLGKNLEEIFRRGRLVAFNFKEDELRRTEISLRGKGTWDLKDELEARGIKGLVGETFIKNSIPETLADSLRRLSGEEN